MPARTHIVIFAPYFHRDDRNLDFADRFSPAIWRKEQKEEDSWPLVPFSHGPAICPGKHIVLLLTSAMLAALISKKSFRLMNPERLDPGKPLPGTLNHFSLRFEVDSRS